MSADELAKLKPLFDPQNVAVVGASNDRNKFGGRPVHFMKTTGYTGRIYPINPKGGEIQGLKAYVSAKDVPEIIDMAVISVPAKFVVDSVRDLADAGARSAVIFSSGFAEAGDEGELWQRQLTEIAAETGIRLVGPNCMGTINTRSHAIGTFTTIFERGWPEPGGISVISQSGAVGAYMLVLALERGLEIQSWITTGNECDVDVSDCVAYCAEDPETKVIVVYIEGGKKGDALRQAFEAARRNGKAVVALKVGASDIGAEAATTHTASLAGADAVYDAVFRQHSVHRAGSLEELLDVAQACAQDHYPKRRRLGVVTISGGAGVIISDAAALQGLDLPALPQAAQTALNELMPFAAVRNPVDTTAQMLTDTELLRKNLEVMIEQGDCDALVIFLATVGLSAGSLFEKTKLILKDIAEQKTDPLMILSLLCSREDQRWLEKLGYLVYEDPTRAVGVIGAITRLREGFDKPAPEAAPALPRALDAVPQRAIGEYEAAQILGRAGLPMAPSRLAASADEAVAAAQALGYPVVLKIASDKIQHKSDVGGVKLHLATAEAVRAAFDDIIAAVAAALPEAGASEVLVAPMITGGVETILGVNCDPLFGPVVLFGLGGVFVEVLKDVTMRVAPFGLDAARAMIDEVKGRAMLDGVRGAGPADIEALAQALAQLSAFAAAKADEIESIDLNPFLVLEQGRGALALDAVIVPKRR